MSNNERLNKLLKLHELEPNDPFGAYGIALEYAKQHEHEQAVQWLDKAIELDSRYLAAYVQKAKSLEEMNRREEAAKVLGIGVEIAASDDPHAADQMRMLLKTLR